MEGERVSSLHAKAILLGFMDDDTRQHTIQYHGKNMEFETLKQKVNESTKQKFFIGFMCKCIEIWLFH